MIFPRLTRHEDGSLAFEDLAPAFILLLLEIPDLLGPDQPDDVRARLFPEPGADVRTREDWEKLVRPELFALLASAREIVAQDLGDLEPQRMDGAGGTWKLRIPPDHVHGWISALNAARLVLGTRFGIDSEEDLHPDEDGEEDEDETGALDDQRIAVAKIHLLGELQAMLILDQNPLPPGLEPGDDEDDDADEDE